MQTLTWISLIVLLPVLFVLVQAAYFAAIVSWTERYSAAGRFFQMPRLQRQRIRRRLRRHAWLLSPIIRLLSRQQPFQFENATFRTHGIAFPRGMCHPRQVERAIKYRPSVQDVFVVTQMKCGTTWMQHLVYQILTRGEGDLRQQDCPINSISPWLESHKTVQLADAPLVGREKPSRIIKTHLPAHLCPNSDAARYIYVTRQPLNCFASCVDFIRRNMGPFAPGWEACETWFCSADKMWWGTWPDHVEGWYRRAESAPHRNVLIVEYASMKGNLAAEVRRVAEFLGISELNEDQIAQIVRKCDFQWMSQAAEWFEMQPPHLLQSSSDYFVSGSIDRSQSIPEDIKHRIATWLESASWQLCDTSV